MTTTLHTGTGSYFYLDDFGVYESGIVSVADDDPNSMQFDNTPLYGLLQAGGGELDLGIDAGTSAVNYGRMAASVWSGSTSIELNDNVDAFGNAGTMIAGLNGTIGVSFGGSLAGGIDGSVIWNTGLIQASDGGEVSINSAHAFTESWGEILNLGTIDANGGTIYIDSDIAQAGSGVMRVENNGTLILQNRTGGGVVDIRSGTLEFIGGQRDYPGPTGSEGFGSTVRLDGPTASLNFAGLASEMFDAVKQQLFVYGPYEGGLTQVADIQILGPRAFSASDFTNAGDGTILFASH